LIEVLILKEVFLRIERLIRRTWTFDGSILVVCLILILWF